MLEARQKYNTACLESNGRPRRQDILAYAHAALRADAYPLAADLLVQLDVRNESEDHASLIGYAYGQARRVSHAQKWTRKAYERQPSALTAYNMSCHATSEQREAFLREALRHDPSYEPALVGLGELLMSRNDDEGKRLLADVVRTLQHELEHDTIDAGDCERLARAARRLGNRDLAASARARKDTLRDSAPLFDDDHLADASAPYRPLVGA